ncbi:hypothetical protein [Paenibacillus gansuensis]|uniref:ABC transporter substrate-binding protein n=1 Tax=Paenibacillus gansuensis TaxID=306542 RepID=A0ABW5PBZ7_9BACL
MKKTAWVKKAAVLAAIASLTLTAACGNANNTASENGKNNTPAPQEEKPAVEVKIDPLGKYETPVKMTVWSGVNDIMKFAPGESIDDNLHTRYMKEFLNIEFSNKWVADGAKINEKVNLDIASNDIPDATQVTLDQLSKLIKNDQVEDLTEAWEKYATPELKANMGFQDNAAFVPATKNGKIYGIPLPYDMGNSVSLMYVRKDWLEKVGMKMPTTIDELVAVAKAFVEQDPDGNGKKDTYAIGMDKGNEAGGPATLPGTTTLDAIAAGMGVYPGLWVKDENGNARYDSLNPKMKDVLTKMQELYKMGAFDPEFAVKDLPKVGQSIAEGKIGIVFGPFYYPIWPLKDSLTNNPKADWDVALTPTLDGSKVVPKALPFANNWIVVRKGYEHPEALIKAMNVTQMMQDNTGEPGKFWKEAGKGVYKDMSAHQYMKPYTFDSPVRNIQTGKEIKAAIDEKDESKLVSSAAIENYKNNVMAADKNTAWAFRKVFYDAEYLLGQYDKLQYSLFFDAPTPEMQAKSSALNKLEFETLTKIIMGAVPVSEFDNFAKKYNDLGGAKIAEEVNEWMKTH